MNQSIYKMRHTLETRYCVEQGLIEAPLALKELFADRLDGWSYQIYYRNC